MTRRHARTQSPEQLLAGDGALSRLLADASAPAQPHELEGLSAALTAFSAHRPDPRRSRMTSLLAKLLAAKALAATAAAASVGGIALAAATGSLPPAAQNAAHDLVGAPAATSTSDSVTQDDTTGTDGTDSAAPAATPSPSLVGLCRAYGAGVADAKGKALDHPAFTVLVTAAGGKAGVAAYCTTLLATAPGGKPAVPGQSQVHKPATHGAPATHPGTGAPATHPGKPTTQTNTAPDTHPTGRP